VARATHASERGDGSFLGDRSTALNIQYTAGMIAVDGSQVTSQEAVLRLDDLQSNTVQDSVRASLE
jgi:hypothetical protein